MSSQTGNRCEKGHNMPVDWDRCFYCEAEERAGQRSGTEVGSSSAEASGRRTSIGGSVAGGGSGEGGNDGGRETRAMPDGSGIENGNFGSPPPSSPLGSGDTRQIVGVLITYSRPSHPWGFMSPIRLGKNFIGAGKLGIAPSDPDCDIQVKEDKKMSSSHALILCRPGRSANEIHFDLVDQQSSNGTYINGDLAPLQGVTLPNYAKIETGGTVWTFVKITP